jgi:hypothetical protein
MIADLGRGSNNGARNVTPQHYENIFNMHREDGYNIYNLLQHVVIPDDLDPRLYELQSPVGGMPYSVLSYRIYGTMNLWWLICTVNNIYDPTSLTKPGDVLKIIKPQHVGAMLSNIQDQLIK